MKYKLWIAGALALLLVLAVQPVQAQTVLGSPHDMSAAGPGVTTNIDRVCVFCHTPHQAAAATRQPPLWNHEISAQGSYGIYDVNQSSTMNGVPVDLGGAVIGSASVSNLCLACHDGTIAIDALYNAPNEAPVSNDVLLITVSAGGNVNAGGFITGTPNVGTDLRDDHPVNLDYSVSVAAEAGWTGLNAENSVTSVDAAGLVRLFGATGDVQCATCHNPHDNQFGSFMPFANTNSALCTTCHNK